MKYIIILSIIFFLTFSCKKERAENFQKKQDLKKDLMNKKWKLIQWKVNPPLLGDSDFYQTMQPCEKDNYLVFQENDSLVYHEGDLKCDPSQPDYVTTLWYLKDDTISMFQNKYKIDELNESYLKFNGNQIFGGVFYKYNYTYIKLK